MLSDLGQSDTSRMQVLRRAGRGALVLHDDLVLDYGSRLPRHLLATPHDLIRNGWLEVVIREYPAGISHRVELTDVGRAELVRLDQRKWVRR